MGLAKTCPHCAKQLSPQELRSFSSRLSVPKAAPCPRCGTRLHWHRHDWWLVHAGALVVLGGAIGVLATVAQWVGEDSVTGFVGVMVAGAAITLFGTVRLRLEVLRRPPDAD